MYGAAYMAGSTVQFSNKIMLKAERRKEKKDRRVAKHRRRNNRKQMWLLDYLKSRRK